MEVDNRQKTFSYEDQRICRGNFVKSPFGPNSGRKDCYGIGIPNSFFQKYLLSVSFESITLYQVLAHSSSLKQAHMYHHGVQQGSGKNLIIHLETQETLNRRMGKKTLGN